MKDAPFKSDFAILDVKKGRQDLHKRIGRGEKVRVRIDLTLDTIHSDDDGVSREFSGRVTLVKEFKSPARAAKRSRRR